MVVGAKDWEGRMWRSWSLGAECQSGEEVKDGDSRTAR